MDETARAPHAGASGGAVSAAPCAASPSPGDDILISVEHALGHITLNRPQSLNALTTPMRTAMAVAIPRWAREPLVYAVVIDSRSARAFCAGGDVRELTDWGHTDPAAAKRSLAQEYTLNWTLECFTKPTVSLMDGLVMGSGAGISLYGTHRAAGEGYRFAMPETGIGFFPDVGVAWAFARMPRAIGMYLALTGRAIGRADAYRVGLVTHCIPASEFPAIVAALSDADPVDPVLDERHQEPAAGDGELDALAPVIARCFEASSVEAIVAALRLEKGASAAWAEGVLDDLARRSPLALKITHRHVLAARALDLREVLIVDYRLACRCLAGHDLYEGVRAALIDKDRAPRWQPARLEDVSEALVDSYFDSLGDEELQLSTRAHMQAVGR